MNYSDDCICPGCVFCDQEANECKKGRWRFPTDGCFDFTDKNDPDGGTTLDKFFEAVKEVYDENQIGIPRLAGQKRK